MSQTVSITSQGQISIPAKMRRELGFSKTNKAVVYAEGGKIVIEPVKDLLSLRGSLKSKVKASAAEVRQAFEEDLATARLKRGK